jgi:NTE family protein
LYEPVEHRRRYFIEPRLHATRSFEDLYVDDDAVARYEFNEAFASLDIGRVFGSRAELRLGVVTGLEQGEPDIAAPGFPDVGTEGYGGWTAAATYDTRDRVALPTRGWLARVRYFDTDSALGSEAAQEYSRLEAIVSHTLPLWSNVVEITLTGGTSFDDVMPVYDLFVLGGPYSFPGLSLGQLRGNEYWAGTARYLHKVADISPLFGQALYFGAQFSSAEMRGRLDGLPPETIYSGALILGGRTPLGPVTLSLATTSNDQWQLVFSLGRPIEEGTIADFDW